jgi:uncharacterized OsmC-like protein
MSVQINVVYRGELRTEATHGPSRGTLITDAPVDNCGKGEAFSPTDLVGAALGTCVLTIAGIFAEKHGLDVRGATASVQKEMTAVPVRRIARLTTEIHLPLPSDHPHREAIERAILSCPVHASLHPEVEKPIRFFWEGQG